MSAANQFLSERDPDDNEPGAGSPQNRDGMGASVVQLPERQGQQPNEEEFYVVETDGDLKPLQQREAPLSEEAGGDKPLIRPEQAQHPEQPRSVRHQRRRAARDRNYGEVAALHSELATMRERLAMVEPRLSEMDMRYVRDQVEGIDRQIVAHVQQVNAAARKMSDAVASADGAAFQAALQEQNQALLLGQKLENAKELLTSRLNTAAPQQQSQPQQQQPQQRQAPPRLAPEVESYVQDFADRYPWYDGTGRNPGDLDSEIVRRIDNAVANEGFDPRTPDYWDEVEDRLRAAPQLQHRFAAPQRRQPAAQQQAQVQPQQRRGPMVSGQGQGGAPAARSNEVYLSPERKTAMMQAGILEADGRTPTDRGRYLRALKSYRQFDIDNGLMRA